MAIDASARIRLVAAVAAVFIVGAMVWLMWVPARQESQTSDEATYVVSGLSYWRTGDFRLNVEHPPLLKEMLAIPLIARGARFFANDSDWNGASQWDIAPKVLYGNIVSGHSLLVSARMVNMVLTVLLVLTLAYWSWKTWGSWGAIITLALAAFEPNILANGHIATTDVGYTLGMVASIVMFGRFLERPTMARMVTAAFAFSFAILTRFNALVLVMLLPMLYCVVLRTSAGTSRLGKRSMAKTITVFLLVSFVMTLITYGFEVRPLDRVQDVSARSKLEMTGSLGSFIERVPFPAASYISGVLWQIGHAAGGQLAYLFGSLKQGGWWYYYPVAIAVKMTLGSLLLVAVAVATATRRGGTEGHEPRVFSGWFIAVPAVVCLVSVMASRLDIGVRYALPTVAMLTVVAGGAVLAVKRFRYWLVGIILAAVLFHIGSAFRAFPHFLPYANEAFGGPPALSRHLNDSNLDWGQDLPLLASYVNRNGIAEYRLSVFSNVPLWAYGLAGKAAPTDQEVSERPYRGVVAVSASQRTYHPDLYYWLSGLTPAIILGHSIAVYDLR